ncbi:MAG: hypothetical protein QW740_03765 [Sulfolobales archaeon]
MASIVGFLAQSLHRCFFESVIKLSLSEEYSYVLVALTTVLAAVYLSIRYVGLSHSVRLSKVLASAFLYTLAASVHILSSLSPGYCIHLQGLSFSLFFISTALLVYDLASPFHVLPILAVFLLIPIPTDLADSIAQLLSGIIGRATAALTGSKIVETHGHISLEVNTPSGVETLSIETVCSGVVALGSVIAAAPVLALLAAVGRARASRKALISLAATALAVGLGLLGNLVRLLLVLYVARTTDLEAAMSASRYSPSALYSSISALASFILASKYGEMGGVNAVRYGASRSLDASWSHVVGVLAFAVAAVSVASLATTIAESALTVGGDGLALEVADLDSLLENPAPYFGTEDVTYLGVLYDGYSARVLGALAAYSVSLEYRGGIYSGYVELVDIPVKLRTWRLLLSTRGYTVTKSWRESLGALYVSYAVAEKSGERYLLTQVVVPAVVRTKVSEHKLFVRVSVFTPFEDLAGAVEHSTELVLATVGKKVGTARANTEVVGVLLATGYSFLVLLAVYLLFVSGRLAVHRIKPERR